MTKERINRRLERLEQSGRRRTCQVCGRVGAKNAEPADRVVEVILTVRQGEPEPPMPPQCNGCGWQPVCAVVVERVVNSREEMESKESPGDCDASAKFDTSE
jgi:hypothetical protein